jgi:hypothetical protein
MVAFGKKILTQTGSFFARMLETRKGQGVFCALISFGATLGIVALEGSWRADSHVGLAFRIAEQSASQAEALILTARQNRERDPIGWALSRLAQGGDSRVIRVARARLNEGAPEVETQWETTTGTLLYRKRLSSEEGVAGGSWWIQVGYLGFLGARSRWVSEFGAFCVWAALAFFLFRLFQFGFGAAARTTGVKSSAEVLNTPLTPQAAAPSFPEPVRLDSARLEAGIGTQRQSLVTLIRNVRDLLRKVSEFAAYAGQIRGQVATARRRQHTALEEIRRFRRELQETLLLVPGAERALMRLERAIEPGVSDWDEVQKALDDAMGALTGVTSSIAPTSSALAAQAATLDELEAAIREAIRETAAASSPTRTAA